jgi:hypothetical protein
MVVAAVGQAAGAQTTEGSVALGQVDLAECYYCGSGDSCLEEEAVDMDCSFPVAPPAASEDAVVEFAVVVVVGAVGVAGAAGV